MLGFHDTDDSCLKPNVSSKKDLVCRGRLTKDRSMPSAMCIVQIGLFFSEILFENVSVDSQSISVSRIEATSAPPAAWLWTVIVRPSVKPQ